MNIENKRPLFTPTLSFDGVAILISVLSLAFFVGTMRSDVVHDHNDIEELKKAVSSLVSSIAQQQQSIAILQNTKKDK